LFDSAQQFWASKETFTKPFVLVCDRILQDASGEQVCREARNAFGLDVYVVLTSGYPKGCVDLSCCDAFLAKPWSLRDFEALLERVWDESL
jgi:CheY-like chemotaxis protein